MEHGQYASAAGSELEGVAMSFGKMNAFIDIVRTNQTKDADGFVTSNDTVLTNVRAYMEERHGTVQCSGRTGRRFPQLLACSDFG